MDQTTNNPTDQIKCPECGKLISAKAKFCSGCGKPVKVKESSTVTILGYKEAYAVNPSVKIFINDEKVGEVGHDEQISINVETSCTLKFKCTFRSAECNVKGGDVVLLSFDRVTGSLSAIVTDAENVQTTVAETLQKDNKKWMIIGGIIAAFWILKHILF
jgi:uncharacterized OB-fold protein